MSGLTRISRLLAPRMYAGLAARPYSTDTSTLNDKDVRDSQKNAPEKPNQPTTQSEGSHLPKASGKSKNESASDERQGKDNDGKSNDGKANEGKADEGKDALNKTSHDQPGGYSQ